ncbi:MAG TPA: Flp family type IVb pilin [Actinomycetota bacterium]|nr:Flp family type IVb pilin [Actinomycetota bacterium]
MLERLKARALAWWLSIREERGATAVEYALMVALIAAVIIIAVSLLGRNASSVFSSVAQTIGSS